MYKMLISMSDVSEPDSMQIMSAIPILMEYVMPVGLSRWNIQFCGYLSAVSIIL